MVRRHPQFDKHIWNLYFVNVDGSFQLQIANKGLSALMVLNEENSSHPKVCADVLSRCKSRRLAAESVTDSLCIQEVAFL